MAMNLNVRRNRTMAAVDFDSRTLRVLAFTPSRHGPKFGAVKAVALDESVDVTSPESLGETLAGVLAEMRLTGCRVVMNVGCSQVVLKPLVFPAGTPVEDLPGMVQYQIAKELPFAVEEAVVDFDVNEHFGAPDASPDAGDTMTVLAAAVRVPVLDFYRRAAETAGVRLERLGLRPQAIGRCVSRCTVTEPGECVAMVNLTADVTEIDLLIDGVVAFSRAASGGAPDRSVWPDERRPATQRVVREVMMSIQSFLAARNGGEINAVLIAGDTGLEDDVLAALSEKVSGSCQRFAPAKAVDLRTGSDDSSFVAAIGAAVAERPGSVAAFDFLSPKRPQVQRDTKQIQAAAIGVGLIVLFLTVAIGRGWYLGGLKAESLRLSRKVGETEKQAKKVESLIQRVYCLEDWRDESVEWLDHWAYLSKVLPPASEAFVEDFRVRGDGKIDFTIWARSRDILDSLQAKLDAVKGYKVTSKRVPPASPDPLGLGYDYESTLEIEVAPAATIDLTGETPGRPADDASLTLLPQKLRKKRSHPSGRR